MLLYGKVPEGHFSLHEPINRNFPGRQALHRIDEVQLLQFSEHFLHSFNEANVPMGQARVQLPLIGLSIYPERHVEHLVALSQDAQP